MRLLISGLIAIAFAAGLSGPIAAQPIPERRLITERDVDLPGGDIGSYFDTTFESCQAACFADPSCTALTFNSRSASCFPKSNPGAPAAYAGAISGRVAVTEGATLRRAEARAAQLDFLRPEDLEQALTQAKFLGLRHPAGQWPAEDLARAAREREAEGDLVSAQRFYGSAATVADTSALWQAYARLGLKITPEDRSAMRRMRESALSAAVNAFLRAATAEDAAASLRLIARGLDEAGRGKATIPALRLAQAEAPSADGAARLDAAIGQYGFRILSHDAENELESPRICAEFSETLAKGQDYTSFVVLPEPGLTVEAEDRRICVGGLSHGTRYQLRFREGLPAESGESLAATVDIALYVRDRSPSARFPGRAYVLPLHGPATLPVETVNATVVDLKLFRMSDRNLLRAVQEDFFAQGLAPYRQGEFASRIAAPVWEGQGEVRMDLNRATTTRLPVGELIAGQPAGIYALEASIPGADPYEAQPALQWFVRSDLGLATMGGTDGLHVVVRSLQTAAPVVGAKVQLVSRGNAILAEIETDSTGIAHFNAGLTRGSGANAPAMVFVQSGPEDANFLSLTEPAFDLSDRGVEGRTAPGPIDGFLATDRGAYRAGDTIHATALLRDARAQALPDLPATAILTRPDGVEYSRRLSSDPLAGGHSFAFPVASDAPRGTWQLSLYADVDAPALARARVLVEDFLPERIDFTIAAADSPLRRDAPALLNINARYLFGTPAAGLPVEGDVALTPKRSLEGYEGYVFGLYDLPGRTTRRYIEDTPLTDDAGFAQVQADFPNLETESDLLTARFTLRVSEGSGRPVERSLEVALPPERDVIGVKPGFEDVAPENGEASFRVISVAPDGSQSPRALRWVLNRLETRYQWYQLYGDWEWEPVTTRSRVAEGQLETGVSASELAVPVEWGEYELVLETESGPYTATSHRFHAGWYAPADTSTTPDVLSIALDKPGYKIGETARLKITPRMAGEALITVLADRVIAMETAQLVEGENEITLPVTDDWGAGVYVNATLIAPAQSRNTPLPARQLGIAYAPVDPGKRALSAQFDTPQEVRPGGPIDVVLSLQGHEPSQPVYATISAVDLGILNITAHPSPDPAGHYFGQRKLGVDLRDLYGRLIDGASGAEGRLRSGGDAGNALRMQSPPPTEELLARFSGPLTADADGTFRMTLDLPPFNGTVRLDAVLWSGEGVGAATQDLLVRDPVVVTPSLPRFLAPGDATSLALELAHTSGPAGAVSVSVSAENLEIGPFVGDAIPLPEAGTARLDIPLTARAPGMTALSLAITLPSGEILRRDLQIEVLQNDPAISSRSRFTLDPGKTFVFDEEVFAGFRPASASATVSLGALARLDAPALLAGLAHYPYGCTEQITSQALPLLYLSDVARESGLPAPSVGGAAVDAAIARVLARQTAGGGFGLWRAESSDLWLDAYVSDFLSRAQSQGYTVPAVAWRAALDNLRNQVNYAADFDLGGEGLAYALHVLAREGAAAMSDLRYYADTKAGNFATPLALAQLGAALAQYGDQPRADRLFAIAQSRISGGDPEEASFLRPDFGSARRDSAALLALAVESGSEAVALPALLAAITPPDGLSLASTQELSWTLLAAHALHEAPDSAILVDGLPAEGPLVRFRAGGAKGETRFTNSGSEPVELTLTRFGVPDAPALAGGNGYAIERAYFTPEGDPLDIRQIQTGTRAVAVLTVHPFSGRAARLMVDDPLPAGLEIENPALLQSGEIGALDWISAVTEPEMAEFRSDRFLAAVDWEGDAPFTLAYTVRAVRPGSYHHPAAHVEDMYRPAYRAQTEASRIHVTGTR
ncbi:alpha-2-macroglobulin family protein [Pseudoruegeria sp. SHC-113]|uniref:alpha-2-macroglobulin family protein n=1 Tax=Pseudoruegeria sp. SHC-113 TaxID=2855439 RepID=UPI0021BA3E7D|nr:alpha-2-macroglobulin family protein [Pseudoruegeria sp. SHC-113]MCT8158802.1 alpha-2-macroglobulin family protein [Pseudoruegeria sp. SHC-113]